MLARKVDFAREAASASARAAIAWSRAIWI
jgi:hypothetical protein